MTKSTVVITGATGLVGQNLVDYFLQLEWNVKAFVRSIPEETVNGVSYVLYSLEKELNPEGFNEVDYVVHAAYVPYKKGNNSDTINLEGTKRLVTLCNAKGIKVAFLSSFSAHDKAVSHYGTNKLACEQLFENSNHAVLKIGFILWNKGILKEMIAKMKTSKFFPLVGGGNQPLQSIYIDDICLSITKVFEKDLEGVFYLAGEEIVDIKTFYREVANRLNVDLSFISIPNSLLFVACRFFETLGIKIPVSSESVLGLKKMRAFETDKTQEKLGLYFMNFRNGLDKVL